MKISKRQRRLAAKVAEKQDPRKFQEVEPSEKAKWMTRAFKNNKYVVMIQDDSPTTHGPAIRAFVQNHTDTPIVNHWAEMQKIKNEIFGPETMAIEYYPPASELTDQHNIYWMWIFPAGVIPKPMSSK